MKILVTGAGGYVGIPLCEMLKSDGHEVTGLDRFYFGKHPNCEYYVNDIRTLDIGGNQIAECRPPIDCVIDLAGLSNDASCDIDVNLTLSINCEGGVNLARLAKDAGVKYYIYSSSASVYGAGDGLALTETSPTNPLTQYAKCKKAVEDELLELNDENFKVVILRNSTIYGVAPRMRFDLAVNIMTARAWRDKLIYVMGGGEQWRPFVHVNDVCDAFGWALHNADKIAGEIFNVGGENITIEQLAYLVRSKVQAKIHHIPDNADARNYNVSFDKINKAGWHASHNVRNSIGEIVSALETKQIDMDDKTCYTVDWYKSLLEWDKRIELLKINGKLL
jgi:nucleoside-diphosphate-sugar epimerase